MATGRYAPSPTSNLHVGNLRTAVVARLLADEGFVLRVEDLDQARVAAARGVAERQLADLAALGITAEGAVVWQSERTDLYAEAAAGLDTYECFCSRKDIAAAAQAPHDEWGFRPYPGTCRDLDSAARARRRRQRPAALRVRAEATEVTVTDRWAGELTRAVDDFVIRRNDGTWAYNLAVVVDDGEAGITEVCRGDDLWSSSPRQAWLAARLGFAPPTYAHVGLVVNAAGDRLAKRDGAVSLADLAAAGQGPTDVLAWIADSLGVPGATTLAAIDAGWDRGPVPRVAFA